MKTEEAAPYLDRLARQDVRALLRLRTQQTGDPALDRMKRAVIDRKLGERGVLVQP